MVRYGATDKEILRYGFHKMNEGIDVIIRLRKRMLDTVADSEAFAKALLECGLAIDDMKEAV